MQNPTLDLSPSDPDSIQGQEGQVCDRCRRRKTKCDGATPKCSHCATADVACEVSVKLRRKTKFRGYSASTTAQSEISRLEKENAQLQLQLRKEIETSASLRVELEQVSNQMMTRKKAATIKNMSDRGLREAQSPLISLSGESEISSFARSAYIIKHMGRMVFGSVNVGRFAGSTTGVHFVASVESMSRAARPSIKPFPEDCFRLHLMLPKVMNIEDPTTDLPSRIDGHTNLESTICALLDQTIEIYIRQLDTFNDTWMVFCPVVPRGKFCKDARLALDRLRLGGKLDSATSSTIQALLMIILINNYTLTQKHRTDTERTIHVQTYLSIACQLHAQVVAKGDLSSLQAVVLFSFYLQITGQTSWLIQVNGVQVRLAQSLGMHRHARRFRFTESETELRKRLWWWVYTFDKLTSLVHGLPKLINDADVDNDLPIDCELNDLDAGGLSHPFPGEPTPVLLHIHYLTMAKLLSSILDQLYTTSHRRGGEEKISRLDRDLRAWHQNLNYALHVTSFDICNVEDSLSRSRLHRFDDGESLMIAWLDCMANFAVVLIHRPALTFDNSTRCFSESLTLCIKACSTLIELASASSLHQRAMMSVPFGPNVIFQSALMQIFQRCSFTTPGLLDESWQGNETMQKAIKLLQDMKDDVSTSMVRKDSLEQCIPLLENLSVEFLASTIEDRATHLQTSQHPTLDAQSTWLGNHGSQPGLAIMHTPTQDNLDPNLWDSSTLGNLNHLDDAFYGIWDGPMASMLANT